MKLLDRSTPGFAERFSALPGKLRADPYRKALLPPEVLKRFLAFPIPSQFWITEDDQGCVGANLSAHYGGVGYVGFFEAASAEAAEALLGAAVQWLRENGAREIWGPVNFNTWFPYRLRVPGPEDHDSPNFAWEPVNPSEYTKYFESAGFVAKEHYHTWALDAAEYVEGHRPAYEKAIAAGYRFRPFDTQKLLSHEVPLLYELTRSSFGETNFLYEPIPLENFRELYVPVAGRYDASFSRFVLSPEGKEIGYLFGFRDGEYGVMKSMAMLPETRGQGLGNSLHHICALEARKSGATRIVAALVRTGHTTESHSRKAAQLWRHDYALFKQ